MKTKKIILGIGCAILALLIFCHFGIKTNQSAVLNAKNLEETTSDDISKITVTFYGTADTQMGITWYTPSADAYDSDVQVFYADSEQEAEVRTTVTNGINTNDASWTWHQVVISGLEAGTKYLYRVGDAKKDCWSKLGTFSTADPDLNEFEFVALSDTQQGEAGFSADAMRKAIAAVPSAAFVLHSGDVVEDSGNEELWTELLDSASDTLENIPILPTAGNHDASSDAFWQHFNVADASDQKTDGAYYSLNYGNMHLAVLNTNESTADDTSYVDEEQLAWLEKDLAEAKTEGYRWIVVNMHIGPYTVGNHANDPKMQGENGLRLRLGAVLERYGVDLVLEGHDHIPCVTDRITQGAQSEDGVIYMDTGAAGPKTYSVTDKMPDSYLDLFQYIDRTNREDNLYQDFAAIQVKDDTMHVTMYERNITLSGDQLHILYEFDIEK